MVNWNGHCISEGQRVQTACGVVPIEEVEVGDFVQSWKDGKSIFCKVKAKYTNKI